MMKSMAAPYQVVDDWAKQYQQEHAASVSFEQLAQHLAALPFVDMKSQNQMAYVDAPMLPDQDFCAYVHKLPITLANVIGNEVLLSGDAIIPSDQSCHVICHLNHIAPHPHAHSFYELCYVFQGGCCQSIAGRHYEMTAGDFLFIPPRVSHVISVPDETSVVLNILIDADAMETCIRGIFLQKQIMYDFVSMLLSEEKMSAGLLFRTSNSDVMKRIIKTLTVMCYFHSSVCDCSLANVMLLFHFLIDRGTIQINKINSASEAVNALDIMQHIRQNYSSTTLGTVAEHFRFSPAHMSRLIKNLTGQNFSNILHKCRLQKAIEYLRLTDIQIAKVAEEIGYNDPTHFIRVFKQEYGVTPHQFRKQVRHG